MPPASDVAVRLQRVLMTTDTVGGVWTYALELTRALHPLGVEVILAAMGANADPAQREEAAALPNLTLVESRYALEWMDDPWADVEQAGEWLLGLERRYRPQVVHLNGYVHAALAWHVPVLVVAHSDVQSWWMAVKGEPAPQRYDRYRHFVGRGLRSALRVAAPSQAFLEEIERFYGLRTARQVLYNGCDPGQYAPAIKEPFLFAAGRLWDEAKNIAALHTVADDLSWPLYVAGEEVHPQTGSQAKGKAHCLGRLTRQQMRQWYARASVYALPARYEPFGLSVLEAALSGCALVLGDVPSLREIWGDAAVYVPPDDARALRSALQHLIEDSPLRSRLAAAAYERGQVFTAERMAGQYMTVYEELNAHSRVRATGLAN